MKKKTVVFISGGFDCLHDGHLYLLREAKKLGNYLIVATNHDKYFLKKGPNRPKDNLRIRMQKILNTGLVDLVCSIEDSPYDLIMEFKPDIIVTGDDYTIDNVVGSKECKEWGGRVILIPRIPGFSTTEILASEKQIWEGIQTK